MTTSHRFATATATTKRSPAVSGGKRGPAVAHLASFSCDPLLPADPQLTQRLGLESATRLFETFVYADLDIVQGDILTVAGADYPIRAVARWPWNDSTYYLHLVVEEVVE